MITVWRPIVKGMILCEAKEGQYLYSKIDGGGIIFQVASVMPTGHGWRLHPVTEDKDSISPPPATT